VKPTDARVAGPCAIIVDRGVRYGFHRVVRVPAFPTHQIKRYGYAGPRTERVA